MLGGGTKTFVCSSNRQKDSIEWRLQGNQEGAIAYLITDTTDTIRAINRENATALDSLPVGSYRIWALVFNGELLRMIGQKADQVELAFSCFSMSTNYLEIEKVTPEAGSIEATGIGTNICSGDWDCGCGDYHTERHQQCPKTPADHRRPRSTHHHFIRYQ